MTLEDVTSYNILFNLTIVCYIFCYILASFLACRVLFSRSSSSSGGAGPLTPAGVDGVGEVSDEVQKLVYRLLSKKEVSVVKS